MASLSGSFGAHCVGFVRPYAHKRTAESSYAVVVVGIGYSMGAAGGVARGWGGVVTCESLVIIKCI